MPGPAPSSRERAILHALGRRIDPSDPGAQNNLGVLFHAKGMPAEAITAFVRALELDPRMALARRNLEQVRRESGYYDRRITELSEQLARDAAREDLRLELGRTWLALGDPERAAAEFQVLHEQRPGDAGALIQLGLAAQASGRHDAATDWFRKAVALEPESGVARVYLGEALYNQGLNEPALEALTEALARSPDNPDLHFLLGFVQGDMGDHEAARESARRAIALNPSLAQSEPNLDLSPGRRPRLTPPPGAQQSPIAGPDPHTALGRAFRARGYLAEALREFRLALDGGEDRAEALEAMAEVHVLRRDFAPALDLYDLLLADQPGNARLWNARGVTLHRAGRRSEARAAYRRAVESDPTSHQAWNNLGVIAAGDPQGRDAEEAFRAALRSKPGFLQARLNLGLFQFSRQRYQEALEEYRAVLVDHPRSAVAWNGVGLVLQELRRTSDARNAFGRAVDADPNLAGARYNLAFALSQLGEFEAALRETSRALELEPYYVPQNYALALHLPGEEGIIQVAPDLMGELSGAAAGEFVFDPALLDSLFEEIAPPAPEEPLKAAADPFALARDYLSKGLLELATAEASRAVGRGAPRDEADILLGEVYARRGLHGEALERFQSARERNPENPRALLGAVASLLALDRHSEAVPAGELLVEVAPTLAEAWSSRARIRLGLGLAGPALEDAREASRLDPGCAEHLLLEGTAARQLGDFEGALQACRAALALDKGLAQAWLVVAEIEVARGNLAEAVEGYRRALEILPAHRQGVLALAQLLCRTDRAGEAVTLVASYLQAEPFALDALMILGQALHQDGRPAEAVRAFDRVLRFEADRADACFHRGAARAALRQYRAAIADWDRVVALEPRGALASAARAHARSARELQGILKPTER